MNSTQATVDLAEIVGRALVDQEFRDRLFDDRDQTLEGITLVDEDRQVLDRLERASFESHAEKLGTRQAVAMIFPEPPPPPEPPPEPEPEPEPEPDPEFA